MRSILGSAALIVFTCEVSAGEGQIGLAVRFVLLGRVQIPKCDDRSSRGSAPKPDSLPVNGPEQQHTHDQPDGNCERVEVTEMESSQAPHRWARIRLISTLTGGPITDPVTGITGGDQCRRASDIAQRATASVVVPD